LSFVLQLISTVLSPTNNMKIFTRPNWIINFEEKIIHKIGKQIAKKKTYRVTDKSF
jgi:hypothetical protein